MIFKEWREKAMEQYGNYLTTGADEAKVTELDNLYKSNKIQASSQIPVVAAYDAYLRPIVKHLKDGIIISSNGTKLRYTRVDDKKVQIDTVD